MQHGEAAAFFDSGFAHRRAMAILRGQTPDATVALAGAAWDAGLQLVEIPLQNAQSADALVAGATEAARRGRIVGAGTITSIALADQAAQLGARFTVAPGFNAEVAAHSQALGMPHLPGVATGTDIQAALADGFTWLKAFPAESLGANWISAMHGPFPEAHFVATGGINARNARQFLAAGAAAVSFGAAFAELSEDDLSQLT